MVLRQSKLLLEWRSQTLKLTVFYKTQWTVVIASGQIYRFWYETSQHINVFQEEIPGFTLSDRQKIVIVDFDKYREICYGNTLRGDFIWFPYKNWKEYNKSCSCNAKVFWIVIIVKPYITILELSKQFLYCTMLVLFWLVFLLEFPSELSLNMDRYWVIYISYSKQLISCA